MPTFFKELAGSPTEQYDSDGFHATRTFLVAWEDRDDFAAEVMGPNPEQGAGTAIHYPGKPTVLAVGLRFEPFDPDAPVGRLALGRRHGGHAVRLDPHYDAPGPTGRSPPQRLLAGSEEAPGAPW